MALLWSMFLPLSARWSLDRARRSTAPSETDAVASIGTVAYTLQVVAIYLFAGLIKLGIPAWEQGAGLAFALRAPAFETALGAALADRHELMRTLGSWVPHFEIFAPLLLLVPSRNPVPRLFCVGAFWVFHAGIGLLLDVGIFVLVSVVVWSVFLPPWIWDQFLPTLTRRLPASWAEALSRIRARIAGALTFDLAAPSPSVPTALPQHPDVQRWIRRSSSILCAGLVVYMLAWNVCYHRVPPLAELPEPIRWVGHLLRIDQRWDMFSKPITHGGWFVIPARLHSGAERELFTGGTTVSWDRPHVIARAFRNDRWRKYMLNLAAADSNWVRLAYGRSICRSWNAAHDDREQLEAFKIYLLEQRIDPWAVPSPPRKRMLWQHECRDELLKRWQHLL